MWKDFCNMAGHHPFAELRARIAADRARAERLAAAERQVAEESAIEERLGRLRELETEGVDLSLLAEQLRLSPTARIESMLRLNELCAALVDAGTRAASAQPDRREM
jgi:hypothetical protein